ncbi:hypothetical protein CHS0354_010468 [Potamilus streckersoni]|uniref:Carrier domain-containing protein n=1 Tax=Potamilus streckersoni TaxID=2493646 RepID=A0AAE0S276_9BIVA|nr:hypothetical protein CHS0354_010468 [Potamilus streckersoni]
MPKRNTEAKLQKSQDVTDLKCSVFKMATKSFPCAAIGEGNLLLKCIHSLLEKGFDLKVVFTNTLSVSQLCEDKQILCKKRSACLEEAFLDNPVDYFFSINNPRVLKENVLKIPHKLSINYHDSPLPAYAGIHATSWAILEGQRKHGISWHVVEAGIDTGDILESQEVAIENDESAFTLNMKCQEAALIAFSRLTDDIKNDSVTRKPQKKFGRSYYGLYTLPPNLGVLNFENDADEIYKLSRGLEFGTNHDNAFGSPKILASTGEFFLVTNIDKTTNFCNETATPGQIVDIVDNTLVVATRTTPLLVSLATLDGVQISHSRHKEIGFNTGSHVPSVYININQLTSIRKMEGFWRRQLSSYEPTIFYRQRMNVVANIIDVSTDIHIRTINMPLPFVDWVPTCVNTELFLQACFVAFMARVSCLSTVAIGILADKSLLDASVESMFSDITPGLFNVAFDENITDVISKCLEDLIKSTNAKTFLKDVFYRYPELRGQKRTPHHNLVIGAKPKKTCTRNVGNHILHDCSLLLLFCSDTMEMRLLYNERPAQDFTHVVDVLRHFPTFLSSITMELQKEINPILKDIALLSKEELEYLYPGEDDRNVKGKESLSTLIKKQCLLSPQSIALKSTKQLITYRTMQQEIESLSANISRHLLKSKKGKPVVGLCFPNSIQYVLSLLATVQSNAAFLPMPLDYPPDRLAFSISDAKVCQILTTKFETPNLPMNKKSIKTCFQKNVAGEEVYFLEFTIENDEKEIIPTNGICECIQTHATKGGQNEVLHSTGDKNINDERKNFDLQECVNKAEVEDFCYVMYTSGSTGRPKGVKVKESSVINLARAQIKEWDLGSDDNTAQFASVGFDASISEIFTAFLSGGTLSVLSPDERLGKEFLIAMKALNVTIITLAPSALNIYGPQDLPLLRKVVSAGEACTLSTAVRWTNNTSIRFFNAYGPTEGTVCSTCYEFIPGTRYEDVNRELPIGRAIDGVCVYLLDDFMKPVPPGVVGEIYIGGKGLAHGYIGNARHFNEQRFVPNPLDPRMSLYKSGDHAFMDPDGTITYAGRQDDQVKIRGQRVDLSEIENVLIQHPKIEMAVVVVHKCSSYRDPKIACFVAPTFVYTSELKEYLSKALPKYMIPNFIRKFELSEFPLTTNGKVDRKKLETDESVHDQEQTTGRSHLNDIQLFVARQWCKVLKLDDSFIYGLHRQSSFTELGGNSLQLVLLLRSLEDTLHLFLSFNDVGTADTIEEFAEVIKTKKDVLRRTEHIGVTGEQELRNLIMEDSTLGAFISLKTNRRRSIQFKHLSVVGKKCSLKNPRNILISGVTGFLGAFLLAELLEETSAHICCMVRESTEARGLGRIIKTMRMYNLWKFEYTSRIAIVLSDLSQERMGVAPDIYDALCDMIDVVFMNAAMMNFNTSYQDHRIANVEGTKEFIEFAMTGVQKYIFFTSSLSVFLFPKSTLETTHRPRTCYESECLDDPMLIEGGYGQSKWASERLVLQALKYLPGGAIFRPARISGRTTDGVGPRNDLFGCTMLGMKKLGCYPNLDFPYDLTPVDYVAKAMVEIALRICNEMDHHEKVYHLFNKDTIPFNKLFDDMNLAPLPLNKWRKVLNRAPEYNKELIPLTPFFLSAFWDKASQWPVFDTSNTDVLTSDETKNLLQPSGELLKLYKNYFGE